MKRYPAVFLGRRRFASVPAEAANHVHGSPFAIAAIQRTLAVGFRNQRGSGSLQNCAA